MMLYMLQCLGQSRAVPDRLVRRDRLLTQTLIIHIIRTAKVPFLESRASAALIATSHHHCGGRDQPFRSLGSAAFWASSRCLRPIGSRFVLILVSYVILTHLMKTWFIRRFGLS